MTTAAFIVVHHMINNSSNCNPIVTLVELMVLIIALAWFVVELIKYFYFK